MFSTDSSIASTHTQPEAGAPKREQIRAHLSASNKDPNWGDGRVGLYAGFCLRRRAFWGHNAGGGHPSRPAVAGRLERPTRRHRAGSPQASARTVTSRWRPFLALLRVGFTEPLRSPGMLVSSYLTVSPLPDRSPAVCFLWHFPAGRPGLPLATTLPYGVRTFLGDGHETRRRDRPANSSVARQV